MIVNNYFLASNPFIDAYIQSDYMGKFIILGLIVLSICSWVLIAYKYRVISLAKRHSEQFYKAFEAQRSSPLTVEWAGKRKNVTPNPFLDLYAVLKKHTVEILNKNKHFFKQKETNSESTPSHLSPTDVDCIQAHLSSNIAYQTKFLEKNLFILSTIVSLAPFLGLLGTVWGILMTFAELQTNQAGNAHNAILGGISLALATTVLGLLDAIPALIGYNYLKNETRDFQTDMDGFSNELLASVEIYYRKVD